VCCCCCWCGWCGWMAGCCSWGVLLDSGTEGTLSPNNCGAQHAQQGQGYRMQQCCPCCKQQPTTYPLCLGLPMVVAGPGHECCGGGAVQGQGRPAMQLCCWLMDHYHQCGLGNSRLQEERGLLCWVRSDRFEPCCRCCCCCLQAPQSQRVRLQVNMLVLCMLELAYIGKTTAPLKKHEVSVLWLF
jgi:hypothetical protein